MDMVKLNVLVVGGGMISQEVIFPTVFQQRRLGKIGEVLVASRRGQTIRAIQKQFPVESFHAWPDPAKIDPLESHPDIYKEAMRELKSPGVVMVATPDHLHTPVIMDAIKAGFDVIVQKPLCLKTAEAKEIIRAADDSGRYVYTDFHKRHDVALRACQYKYRRGLMGESLCSHAWIEERREMPLKNFSLWAEQSSSFEYIGCHYVDMFYFITGERPKKVIAFGQKKYLPKHGKNTFDAVEAIIEWESGAVQYVQTSWVLPDGNPNLTNQGFQITCTEGEFRADNADRNSNFVTAKEGYQRFNPHFFKPLLDWNDFDQDLWAGYGGESIIQPIDDIIKLNEQPEKRPNLLKEFETTRPVPRQALIATAVVEAVRMSLANGNRAIKLDKELNLR
jgi:D-galacturonate reductase